MTLIDSIAKRLGYSKTRALEGRLAEWQAHYAGGEMYNLPDPSVYGAQADYYRKLSWVAGAVQILAQVCAIVEFGVYQVEGEEETALYNHLFEQLLFSPNPMESRFEFLEAWFSYRILTGNGYAWLNTSGPKEPPAEIWSLPSNMVIPVPDERMYLKGYLFYPGDGAEIPLEPWEIVHLKRFNPHNRFIGMSPMEAVALSAELDLARLNKETKTYKANNGRLPAILTFPEAIPDPEWNKMKSEIDDKANAMRNYLMLRNTKSGVGVVQSQLSAVDQQFIQNREFTRDEIYNLFAPGLASMLAINATEANAKSGKATFNDFAVWPLLESGGQKISNDILPSYGPNLRGKFRDTRIKDRAMELQEIASYSQTHTVAEVRSKFYKDDPLGDERDKLFVSQVGATGGQSGTPAGTGALPGETPPNLVDRFPQDEPLSIEEVPLFNGTQGLPPGERGLPPGERGLMSQKMWREMEIWQTKEVKRVRSGKSAATDFRTEFIPAALAGSIAGALATAQTEHEVKLIFANAAEWRNYP